MCCFTRPVTSVKDTNIFARPDQDGRQFLVYSMSINAKEDLAMVLPLPVKPGTGEKGVRFIDLSEYKEFFFDLSRAFPPPPPVLANDESAVTKGSRSLRLEVVQVGSFEASFVPTNKDFSRLDERFRLPAGTWNKLPQYSNFGFAVFKLKRGAGNIHPMAFSFPRRDTKNLFFPTVHIHDGKVHEIADFNHTLYCQPTEHEPLQTREWEESTGNVGRVVNIARAKGIVDAEAHCYRKNLSAKLPNRDTLLSIAA